MARQTPGERLHAWIASTADKAAELHEPSWGIFFDRPWGRFFCNGEMQVVALARVLYADRIRFKFVDTDRDGITCVVLDPEHDRLACVESMMKELMQVLRANGCHGTYRKAGETAEYKF